MYVGSVKMTFNKIYFIRNVQALDLFGCLSYVVYLRFSM